jgi:dihydropteroate synthase
MLNRYFLLLIHIIAQYKYSGLLYVVMTQLAGILNVTPDSFSDGGLYFDTESALKRAGQLLQDGATLVDIGAESTRPGAVALNSGEEWRRLKSILPPLIKKYPESISVDTYHPETAERALKIGRVTINDVTGMNNPNMIQVIKKYMPYCIVCHLPAEEVQLAHRSKLLTDIRVVVDDLMHRRKMLLEVGLNPDQIILDPGIGFGKTPELNYKLLRFAELVPGIKVMIGYSRKRFLGEHRMDLATNLAAGRIAIKSGAAFLRVHDVVGHRQLIY